MAITKKNGSAIGNTTWYKDAVIYELHVRAFYDSDGDGIGDFKGLTEKLDYLRDLGVTALWLLPFFPSPLKDDGYDISDYAGIHPSYGTLSDFKVFIREAHRRGLKVITELVVNHTSDQHNWFQRARRTRPGSKARDYYVWSDTPDRYSDARIIFQDFESSNWSWDPVAKAYYWHRFYRHQPDLNYDNPEVRRAVFRALDFWMNLGVDGLRLDAVPYLYEREGTNCENLPETHSLLRELRKHIEERFPDRLLLAEANQWPEDAAEYFGRGDECQMAFHFPIMPRMFMALHMEDRFPIIDILEQTPAIPDVCQWAIFLRNHDELTLEMVTDEERDYMYRVYADDPHMRINLGIRRRLAPLLSSHRRKMELMNSLLFSLPGTPVMYYGDEIGMGDNVYLGDRNGVRTPMQWSSDRNAGFSRANPQSLYLPVIIDPSHHYETFNVEAQLQSPSSFLWWTRRLIGLRKRYKAFGRGSIEFLRPDNRKVLTFIRRYEQECILVVANLSRFVQYVQLDLAAYKDCVPVELFGRTEFPRIGESPYFLSLGPHSFYWFFLTAPQTPDEAEANIKPPEPPMLDLTGRWDSFVNENRFGPFEQALPRFLYGVRWFRSKAKALRSVTVEDVVPMLYGERRRAYVLLIRVEFEEGEAETYLLPLTGETGGRVAEVEAEYPHWIVARFTLLDSGERGILYDAMAEKGFCSSFLHTIATRKTVRGRRGILSAQPWKLFRTVFNNAKGALEPRTMKAEQTNTSVAFGEAFMLKLYRGIDKGVNPDLEIGRFLTEKPFDHTPPVCGFIEYRRGREEPMTAAILHGFVPNHGDAWEYTRDVLDTYLENTLSRKSGLPIPEDHTVDLAQKELPPPVPEVIGVFLESVRMLGKRTAEMHAALASSPDDPDFAPEPFSQLYQRSLYQSMRSLTTRTFLTLRKRMTSVPDHLKDEVSAVLAGENEVQKRFRDILGQKLSAGRIRCHGDFHLGQVLFTGNDFFIMDFEGEPSRTLSERRIKRSPLRDVAGMLRSLHYAAYSALFAQEESGLIHRGERSEMETALNFWYTWVGAAYLKAYLDESAGSDIIPSSGRELKVLLDVYLLEKAVYELAYELNNRPGWLVIPLQGIRQLLRIG